MTLSRNKAITCQVKGRFAIRIWTSVKVPRVGENTHNEKVDDKRADKSKSRLDRVVFVSFSNCPFVFSVYLNKLERKCIPHTINYWYYNTMNDEG